jgi:single-strand DNA-binding protein
MIRVTGAGTLVKPYKDATDAVELKELPSGTAVAKMRVKSSNKKGKDGEWTHLFIDVECWGSLAQNAALSLSPGDQVVFSGLLQYEEYEKRDGSKGEKWKIRADDLGPGLSFGPVGVSKAPRFPPGEEAF